MAEKEKVSLGAVKAFNFARRNNWTAFEKPARLLSKKKRGRIFYDLCAKRPTEGRGGRALSKMYRSKRGAKNMDKPN